jgi:hypothetical protein
VPVFASDDGGLRPCSQLDLARALTIALQEEAHVVNISGGQFTASGEAHPLLADVVRACERRRMLIVAAAGNDGCNCLNIPAALPTVLAVGATDDAGEPLPFSNWGERYRRQGIVAPGLGGTSSAAAVVSGAATLLLSVMRRLGRRPDPLIVRESLRQSAIDCAAQPATDCRRLLLGRLDILGAMNLLLKGTAAMSASAETSAIDSIATPTVNPPATVVPSGCGCGGGGQLTYALGQIGFDLVGEARLDSLAQKIAGSQNRAEPQRAMAQDPRQMLDYLEKNPWEASSITWTLNVDGTPVYAITPKGPFAADAYRELRRFLNEQIVEGVERVSIPGVVSGSVRLLNGHVVPAIVPELRGMYSWTTKALVDAVVGAAPAADAPPDVVDDHRRKAQGVRNFLDRVYHGLRNLGQLPHDRAINFAATNAFEIEEVYESAMKEQMDLDTIHVAPSPICRPGSDCWDVELYFFFPQRQVQTVRKVYRFTVDVSDVVPVTVGVMRSWFTR